MLVKLSEMFKPENNIPYKYMDFLGLLGFITIAGDQIDYKFQALYAIVQ